MRRLGGCEGGGGDGWQISLVVGEGVECTIERMEEPSESGEMLLLRPLTADDFG